MPPVTFSVSEVRVAATCPRILYFDAEHTRRHQLKTKSVTRIWKDGDAATTACGSLFHNAVERFNRNAAIAPEIRAALEGRADRDEIERELLRHFNLHCVDRGALVTRGVEASRAFINVVRIYMGEMADIVADARARGKPPDEILGQMFGDRRRRVDVTFQVGPGGEPVHVTGILDYVFYDWRTENHRIIDYKLTPAHEPSNDLFQISLYALMHHIQHRTQPDVGVLYLHPHRRMVEMGWDDVRAKRHVVYDLLASMADWVAFDEHTGAGLGPIGEPSACAHCRWNKRDQCVERLGPKHEGRRHQHWTDSAARSPDTPEPAIGATLVDEATGHPTGPVLRVVVEARSAPFRSSSRSRSPESAAESTGVPAPAGEPLRPGADLLQIGTTMDGDHPVGLPLAALPTHVAVVGAAGGGKTWMAKVLAEEAVRLGVPVLAIDPQGDLVQLLRPSNRDDRFPPQQEAWKREYHDRVEPRVWTPGSSHARRLGLNPVRLASPDELTHVPADRREEEWRGMLATAASQLVDLAGIGGEQHAQEALLLQLLVAMTRGGGHPRIDLARVAEAVSDPGEFGVGDPDLFIRKSEREKFARKLNALIHGPAARLYDGGTPLDLDAMCRADAPGKTPLNVVYLNALSDDAEKHFVVAALAAEIYRWMVTSLEPEPRGRPNLLVYIDEARDFIPAGGSKPPAKAPLIRLFTQGRKYGVASLICTQSPRSVDYNVFGNCSTKLIGRLESAQDLDRVADWFGNEGTPAWLSGRKGAVAGSFVGRWPDQPAALEGRAYRSRPLFSLHEGAWSPDRLDREIRGSEI